MYPHAASFALCLALTSSLIAGPARQGPSSVPVDLSSYKQVFYVSPEAAPGGDGSLQKPWKSVAEALQKIKSASPTARCAVLVGAGTIADDTIQMKEHVDLFGGFNETWQRDPARHPTVLSGERSGRILIGANFAVLDGFIITRGRVKGKGAGLLCDGTSPFVRNNVFLENSTLAPANWTPKNRHEIANDGAAVYAVNKAAPVIENNLFVANTTESGRGAGIAFHAGCKGRIAGNVFLDNVSGTNDPNRSSDGAAVSVFDWSSPTIENNLFIGNRALAKNDSGGLFIALWSAPLVVGNVFVGNEGTDDAGALFFGGQEHRYDTPLDPLPPAESFYVLIDRNYFAGNTNSSRNSGAMRFTMEGRGRFSNNVCLENQVYFQRSEVDIVHNTIMDAFRIVETKEGLGPSKLVNNIIWGPLVVEAPVSISYCNLMDARDGQGNLSRQPELVKDGVNLQVESATYDARRYMSSLKTKGNQDTNGFIGRAVNADGKWSVVHSAEGQFLTVWGDLSRARELRVAPTGRLAPHSPGVDAGAPIESVNRDMDGQKRPQGKAPDIGADEVR